MRAHSFFRTPDAAAHRCLASRGAEGARKREQAYDKEEMKKRTGDFVAVRSDAGLRSIKFNVDVRNSLSLSLQTRNLAGRGSGERAESSVGGGVGLLERVIFFLQAG